MGIQMTRRELPPPIAWASKLLACLALGLCGTVQAQAVPLYEGSLGSLPSAQGWTFGGFGGSSTQTLVNNAAYLDTRGVDSTKAGYTRSLTPINSDAGFTLAFTVQVTNESHTGNDNRAGFSVILLDSAHKGVEIGFWTNQVFAQSVSFIKAEVSPFDTTAFTQYQLSLYAGQYALTANGSATPLLTGVMRDYSVSNIPVYFASNFIFLGDDTTSAQARVGIAEVSIVPLPPTWVLMLAPVSLMLSRRAIRGFRLTNI
jgi:hypothetical protein